MADREKIKMTMAQLGRIAITPAALEYLESEGLGPDTLLDKHIAGDWGEFIMNDDHDYRMNKKAIQQNQTGDMVLSSHTVKGRQMNVKTYLNYNTTIYFPEED